MTTVKVKHLYIKTFLIALGTAMLIFLPAMCIDKGYFLFVGDFNSQQIPFYMNAHDSIRAGEWAWNWYTDIGANFIGSYTFYLLGSPFFYLTIPFPSSWVPYMLGPLLMLKYACCALMASIYVRRYVKNEYLALLGGLLYAFSGYSIYNTFFNHFHDVMVFFPLLLISLDEWMDHGTKGVFALSVCINALVNYFFFFGEVVFVMLYYFVRLIYKGYDRDWKKFFGIVIEAVLGFMMSFILMLPSALTVMQNSRVSHLLSGFSVWLYGSKERLPAILFSFLLPPELPSKQVFLPDANTKWTSLTAFLPVMSVTGVLVYIRNRRHNWLSKLLLILLVMALIPGFNALFVAFNSAYYARWFYMLTLLMILASMQALDRHYVRSFKRATWQVLALTVAIVAAIGLTPQVSDGAISRWGLYDTEWTEYFIVIAGTSILCLMVFSLFIMDYDKDKTGSKIAKQLMIAVCIFAVAYGNFFVFWGKSRSFDTKNYIIPDAIEGREKITIPDRDEVIRIDADDALINMGMFWKVSCMRAFHSVVPGSIMDFYEYIGEERSVNSKIPEIQYAVRGLLSVHWYFDRIDSSTNFGDPNAGETTMPGYSFYDTMAGYNVWENTYYIPMGYTYNEYITMADLDSVSDANKANMMLHAVALDEAQALNIRMKIGDALVEHSNDENFGLNKSQYYDDCNLHQMETVKNLVRTKKGITCTSDFDGARLIYFSIPFDDGWRCLVDGEEVSIEKVNVGFMGIVVSDGHHDIEFIYETPGLKVGALCSLAGLLLLGAYVAIGRRIDAKKAMAVAQVTVDDVMVDDSSVAEMDESIDAEVFSEVIQLEESMEEKEEEEE